MKTKQRMLSVVLLLALALSLFSGVTVSAASPSGLRPNTGVRHQVCAELSEQALDYYEAENTSYALLSALDGDATGSCLSAVDSALYAELHDIMASTMTDSISYSALTSYWPKTDANNGSSDAILFYSDEVSSSYNREHVWPKSRASFYQSGGGSDLHHLRPTNTNVNSTRGNMTMGNVRGVISGYKTYQYNGADVLYYATGSDLVEINDDVKGDVARIFLYVYVRWEERNLFEKDPNPKQSAGDTGGNNGLKVIESLDTLLQWCEMDPVDTWEMERNDLCQDVQGNRNVFIDYPELAWLLFGRDIPADMETPSGNAQEGGVNHAVTARASNPAMGSVTLSGRTVTAVPAPGCYTAGAVVTPAGAATVTQNGNTFRLSDIRADCTVTVNFAEKTAASISYLVPEGVSVSGTTAAYIGDEITLPAVSGVPEGEYTFVGWAKNTIENTTDRDSLALYGVGSTYMLDTPETAFHAVYSYKVISGEPGDADTFRLVTEAADDWSGDYVISGSAAGVDYALLADGSCTGKDIGSTSAAVTFAGAGLTKNGDTLENVTDRYVVTVEQVGDGVYTIALKGASTPVYLSFSGSSNGMFTESTPTVAAAQWKLEYRSGTLTITNVGSPSRFMQFNTSSKQFRCYTSSQGSLAVYAAAASTETHYLTLNKETVPEYPFVDMPKEGNWARPGVEYVIDNGLMGGTDATHFSPNDEVSRAMLVTTLWRAAGSPQVEYKGNFSDVKDGKYYTTAVAWAAELQIVRGDSNGRFNPTDPVTRQDLANVLFYYAKAMGVDTSARCNLGNFSDGKEISGYAKEAMSWLVAMDIIRGADGKVTPLNSATREQFALILMNFIEITK